MLKKTIRRLGALAMVLAMAVSVFAVNASAAGTVNASQDVTITKNITADANVRVPGATYTFTITAGDPDSSRNIYAGEMEAISQAANDIVFTEGGGKTGNTTFTITAEKFTKPGIYRYIVTETVKAPTAGIDGMTLASAKTLLVYVEQVDGVNSIAAVIVDGATEENKSDFSFTNTYNTNNVTVKKEIEGNQADLSAKWEFTIIVTGQPGEKFATNYTDPKTNETVVLETGVPATVYLGDDETITIYGLSESDTYNVTEVKHNTDGYETKIDGVKTANGVATGNAKEKDVSIVYTNTKQITTPGGVIMTIAPYALMLVLAGAFAVVFLSRRNRAE